MLAILAMLARKGALRVAPGGSAPPIPCAPLRGFGAVRSGRESRLADRTGKRFLHDCRLDHGVPLWIERDLGHRRPIPGRAAPAPRVAFACPLIEFVAAGQQRTVLAGVALRRGWRGRVGTSASSLVS